AVLPLEPLGRVPDALRRHLETALAMLGQLFGGFAGAKKPGDLDRPDILAHEELAFSAVVILLCMWCAVAELSVDPLAPHVGRFDKVGIRRNYPMLCHALSSCEGRKGVRAHAGQARTMSYNLVIGDCASFCKVSPRPVS